MMRAKTVPMRPLPTMPDAAAMEVEAEQAIQREVALADAVVGAGRASDEAQDERHRVLGHGVRRVGRHARDADADLASDRQVDIVEAGRAQGHQPGAAPGQLAQQLRVELVVDEGADGREAGRQRGVVAAEPGLEEVELVAAVLGGGGEGRLGRRAWC